MSKQASHIPVMSDLPKYEDKRERDVVIVLESGDLKSAYETARARDDVYDHKGADNVDESERTDIHIAGAKGEHGLAKYWQIGPNTDVLDGPDPGYDYVVDVAGIRVTVDIKTKRYWSEPHLIVPVDDAGKADVYVLAAVDGVRVRLVGYVSAFRLQTHDAVYDFGDPCYRLVPGDMRAIPGPDEVSKP